MKFLLICSLWLKKFTPLYRIFIMKFLSMMKSLQFKISFC